MAADDPDADDVRRVLAGETDAFEAIVRRWQGRLVNLAWRFSRDRQAAEEMAQDAFVAAFKALRTFRGEAAFSTWLTAVALNSYRASLRRDGPPPAPLDPGRLVSTERPMDERLSADRNAEAIRHAVATLPARYRDALVLFYFEEQALAETARVLGLKEGTLKARLHRGREMLKRRCLARGITFGRETSTP